MQNDQEVYECIDAGPKGEFEFEGKTYRLCRRCAELVLSLGLSIKRNLLKAITRKAFNHHH